ncbi:class I SAM-dependent methyltransferase [Spirulina sp. CS-785/01]|uniref:class I SAM-dependent methyltransferase n=1 Tax=Spirulina sp. CS-785/01 TaxID=3021716 RepID=UPI00232C2F3B|nr:class I SAM-dependent methyltransferase [Spirulina sp. CS-785/01]MDB9315915.1 class I SAM-dependent methyltransferase [Spirulina sp. CS-785/01]
MTTLQDKYNRTEAQIRHHYEVEKELANRLRNSTKEERKHLYNDVYDELYQKIPHEPLVERTNNPEAQAWVANQRLELLGEFLAPDKTYGEIGPGDCCVSLAVTQYVKQVYAIDVSQEISKKVKTPDNFKLVLFDGCNIPLPENSLDIVYSNQVIEHLHPEDALDQITSIFQVLALGGFLICITPHRLSGPHDISQFFDQVATCFHLKEYSIKELYQVLYKAGFGKIWLYKSYKKTHFKLPLNPLTLTLVGAVEGIVGSLPFKLKRKVARLPLLFRGITMVAQKGT